MFKELDTTDTGTQRRSQKVHENDYTGSPVEDDDSAFLAAGDDLYEFSPDDEALADEYADLMDGEQVIHFGEVANGAKSLREAAQMLYDFADDLTAMSEEGWEIVDDVTNGHGTAVRFGLDDEDSDIPG
jgi:hypothetical protein